MLYFHKKGKYQTEANQLFDSLVPDEGQADTLQGELIRCITRLASEMHRNGNANWDKGFKIMALFLKKHLSDGTFSSELTKEIKQDISLIIASGKDPENNAYIYKEDDSYTRITDRVVEWCKRHPEPVIHIENPKLLR